MLRPAKWLVIAFGLILAAGCATPGPRFEPEQPAPPEQALVYLYRDSGIIGSAVAYTVRANGVDVAKLPAGGYFVYYAPPGEIEFSAQTEAKTSVTLDVKAGGTYYVKGTIGVGVFVGHPHLVQVPNDVGARDIVACSLVPGTKSTAPASTGRPTTAGGPMRNAAVDIDVAEIVSQPAAPADLNLRVTDRRTRIVMERTTIGRTAMSAVALRPAEAELVRSIMTAKLIDALAARASQMTAPAVDCDITEFSVTTPATVLYWDVTVDVTLTLRAGERQRPLTAHAVKRTYAWPSAGLIKAATTEALQAIAAQSEPALTELLAVPAAAPTP